MKVFFTYQGVNKVFNEFDVSSSITVSELLVHEINQIIANLDHDLIIAVNIELLDGNFKVLPINIGLKKVKELNY